LTFFQLWIKVGLLAAYQNAAAEQQNEERYFFTTTTTTSTTTTTTTTTLADGTRSCWKCDQMSYAKCAMEGQCSKMLIFVKKFEKNRKIGIFRNINSYINSYNFPCKIYILLTRILPTICILEWDNNNFGPKIKILIKR